MELIVDSGQEKETRFVRDNNGKISLRRLRWLFTFSKAFLAQASSA